MTHVSVSGTGVSPVRFSLARNSKSQARRLCHGVAAAVLFFSFSLLAAEPGWKAGTAKASITPEPGLWMAGFAARTNPADGKIMELWIKALALEDADGHRAVILTSDLLGIPQNIYQHSCAALKEKFNLAPDQTLLSASHTHCGPVLRNALYDIYPPDQILLSASHTHCEPVLRNAL